MRLLLALPFALSLVACGSTDTKQEGTTAAKADQPGSGEKDKSRCDSSGKKITTVDINGDGKPDVWKFYAYVVENGRCVLEGPSEKLLADPRLREAYLPQV